MKNKRKESGTNNKNFSEAVKNLIEAAAGTVFTTEEVIRNTLSDTKLPKDLLKSAIKSASQSKKALYDKISGEVKKSLDKVDFVHEAARFIKDHKFKINIEIEKKSKPKTKRKKKG